MSDNEPVEDADLYLLLEVSPEATKEEITKAYRKKAVKCHPDKNPGNPKATQDFQFLLNAYTLLLDENTRIAYDIKWMARKAEAARQRDVEARRKEEKRRQREEALRKRKEKEEAEREKWRQWEARRQRQEDLRKREEEEEIRNRKLEAAKPILTRAMDSARAGDHAAFSRDFRIWKEMTK